MRRHLLWVLRQVYEVSRLELPDDEWGNRLDLLVLETTKFENFLRLGLSDDNELLREVSRMDSDKDSLFQRLQFFV